jgi:monomeric type NADP-dependent isocitrate dehydrogenase
MDGDDFYGSEQSHVVPFDIKESSTHKDAGVVRIEFVGEDGSTKILKNKTPLQPGEVIDASKMDVSALREFYKREIDDAKDKGVLFSLHLKATMMKVSDPIMFGHCVEVFYRDTFAKHADFVKEHQVDATKGLGDFYAKLEACGDSALKEQISNELEECLKNCDHVRPPLAMVDSDRGVTNLHVPSDIIIDASMPAALRESGKMWGPDGELADTKYVIPDRSYATSYKKVVEHCIEHGAFDPSTMGAVSNVGLMAQKAQEYGSHDKTFEAPAAGSIRVVARDTGEVCFRRLLWSRRWRRTSTLTVASMASARVPLHPMRHRRDAAPPRRHRRVTARRSSWNTTSSKATSGACARPRTRRSRTGCASRWPALEPRSRRPSSGWMPRARTTPTSSTKWRRTSRTTTRRAWILGLWRLNTRWRRL